MITADQVMGLLAAATPSFREKWIELESEELHRDEDGTRLHYLDASQFAQHLVRLLRQGATREVRAAFDVIERLHLEGDAYVAELATIGILEDVLLWARRDGDVDPSLFLGYLGPESLRWWRGLVLFWDGRNPAVFPVDGAD